MAYTNPKMSSLFRSIASASQERSATEGWADALNNPAYVAHWEVPEPARELASGGESDDNTLTEAMAAAQISSSASTTTSEPMRPLLPRPRPPRLVMFQRGGPQALELPTLPPPTPGWNSNEEFVYQGEMRPARPTPPPPPSPDAEEELQVDAMAEETEEDEEEEEETRCIMREQNAERARKVIALLDTDVLDSMSTDELIWIMQAGFQSLMSRRVHH